MLPHNIQDHYARKLTAEDEDQFIQLLTAVYGNTYSYQFLYDTGGFSSLINEGRLTSYGEFDYHHRLISHTGFWRKEINSDYVESGCSFRLATGSLEFKVKLEPLAWQECFTELARNYAFIHQQCSTLHSLAQRYASQFMHAKPCGILVHYAENEKIKGLAVCQKTMHALVMTSILQPHAMTTKTIYITEPFHAWLNYIYINLNLPRNIVKIKSGEKSSRYINMLTLEDNPHVSLQRRLVTSVAAHENTASTIQNSGTRSDIIHLPMESASLMSAVLPVLLSHGYMPCGVRPHMKQADELILQHLANYRETLVDLNNQMKIADKNTKLWMVQWQNLILQIM